MKRALLISWLLTLCFGSVVAQAPNGWINFDQPYFKIPVGNNGIYKLSYSSLQNAGFPVGSVDPARIQLYHRGEEHAIFVEGEVDGQLNPADFILFYGKRNDGTLDTALYRNPSHQPHRYHNLVSDTTAYFLTIGSAPGKRMNQFSEANTGNLPSRPYHIDEKLQVYADQYAPGENYQNEVHKSSFDLGEGWSSNQFMNGQSKDVSISNITGTYTLGPAPRIDILLVGRSNSSHSVEILVGPSLRVLTTVSFSGVNTNRIEANLDWSDIGADGKLNIQVRALATGQNHYVSVSYVRLNYAQIPDGQNSAEKVFHTVADSQTKGYIEIANAPSNARIFDITNENDVRIIGTSVSATLNAVFPSADEDRVLLLTNTDLIPDNIRQVNFRKIVPADHDYVIITHPALRQPGGKYSDPVKAYAEYRASEEGGSYDTLIVNINDLYDQFNYGETSPLAIYRFVEFISNPKPPKYLFIIGKGLELWYNFNRAANQNSWTYKSYIPPAGFPGSDLAYSIPLNGTSHIPTVPTGRLSVSYPKQVANYLDKIKEKENLPVNDLWQKKILHLSGGIEEGEPEYFRSILENYATIAEGRYFGGQVTAIAKKSRDLEVVNIGEEVNNGLSLVTFFGHSSPSTLDFDIGFVTDPKLNYHNKGKYPLLLMNGCEVGAFFLADTLFGESWVYAKDRGAAAFIAHNAYGLLSSLSNYSEHFYKVAFADSIFFGKGIGDIQQETVRRILVDGSHSIFNLSQTQQMMLLGDPAVKLFGAAKSDLEILNSEVSAMPYNGSTVTAIADSFAIKMIVKNYGMARLDTFRIEVERILSDNTSITYDSLFQLPLNADTIQFVIRNTNGITGSGNNTFKIFVDADEIIPELNEENNRAEYTLFVPSNGTKNLFPAEFGIVGGERVSLSFQTTDLFSDERDFLVEVDTLNSFDSPFLKQFTVKGKVLATAPVDLVKGDTVAYYWRTRLADPLEGESDNWTTSSFTHIKGNEGWAQVHFPQLMDDATVGLDKDLALRRIEFEQSVTSLQVLTYGAGAGKPRQEVSVKIKGEEYNLYSMVGGWWGCQDNTVNLIAFDKKSTAPYIGVFLKWYELGGRRFSCGREPFVINSFTSSDIFNNGVRDIIQYVNNVAEGDSVLLFNIGNAGVALWPSEAKTKLEEIGISATQLDELQSGEPFVILAKKGSEPGSALIIRSENADPTTATLYVNKTITGGYDEGRITTPLIGPSTKWQSVIFKATELEPQDNISLEVLGVTLDRKEEVLIPAATSLMDLSAIDAQTYPYLRLRFFSEDKTLLTSPQLEKWMVMYTPVPEGVLIPEQEYTPVELNEGEDWKQNFRFVNITEKTFADSLNVKFTVFNHNRSSSRQFDSRILSPAPFDTTRFEVTRNSQGFGGSNDAQLYINPRIDPEQYYDNNVIQLFGFMNVVRDNTIPLLDVTFDGRHIFNGDFVSDSPDIAMELWDENSMLFKSDTSGVQLYLTYPCEQEPCLTKRIWMKSADVEWHAATAQSNFKVIFTPEDLIQGEYEFKVEATDASGNNAEPFRIKFNVMEERSIQIVPLHPNPLIGQARYGFILTAGHLPENMTLRVMDIAGKTLFTEEIANEQFYVGKNYFYWEGRDQNGNLLKPGMYLYVISVTDIGNSVIHKGKVLINR